MNTGNKPINEPGQRDSDADISLLLYKTGKSFKQFLLWLGRGFKAIGGGLLVTLLFLFRNFIWLAIGAALGIAYGVYKESTSTAYSSQMVVKANHGSSRSLYSTVDYLNSLIYSRQAEDLAKFFEITPKEASQLTEFVIEPMKSELITSELYKDAFLKSEHERKIRSDTFWTRTIKYEDFKESLTKYDYPFQIVTAYTTNPVVFAKLSNGIGSYIEKNALLNAVRIGETKSNADEEILLETSIKNLDSLRRAYNERLAKGQSITQPANQVTIMQGAAESVTPALDLYDKLLALQDELKKSRIRSATEKNVIEILSPFNPVGRKLSFIKSVGTMALVGFLAVLAILLFVAFYKWLVVFESSQSTKRKNRAV